MGRKASGGVGIFRRKQETGKTIKSKCSNHESEREKHEETRLQNSMQMQMQGRKNP
jgi:DNA polymerase/3'-5' exonuclease PolX